MDALLTKNDKSFKLSDLGLTVRTFDVSAPSLQVNYQEVTNRSGRIKSGHRFVSKVITITGSFYAMGVTGFNDIREDLYAELMDERGYYLTKMSPTDDLYNFERPGQTSADIDTSRVTHEPERYRYRVINTGDIAFIFKGKSNAGLLYGFSLEFETIGMPFGETIPKTIRVTNNIPYAGTAINSQLESPWYLKLTATQAQKGDFYVQVGDKRFEHKSLTQIKSGDVFQLRGVETWLNFANVNEYTNYEYFELTPTVNHSIPLSTDFVGTIEVVDLIEFYK
ncbi:phage tail domain-containing protein [Aerococcus urinaeequi]